MTDFLILANSSDLLAARIQMAFTLGFHIILACLGVGMPVLLIIAEGKSLSGNAVWREIAIRWSRAFAVIFAVGAVSGTVLSFELGLLWPEFMGRWGAVIGLPFTLEGFAFFIEAIFVGIYLYGWDRISPRMHWLTAFPIAVSGAASAWFVVTANAWMNAPQGFVLDGNDVVSADPWQAMLNPATGAQTTHMILAAYMVTGFLVAGYSAVGMLRGRQRESSSKAMQAALFLAVIVTPAQMVVGDWSAKVVHETQPVKFAAMEAHFHTQRGAPLHLGGIPNQSTGQVHGSIEIPRALSFLTTGDWNAEIQGLEDFDDDLEPPVLIVHLAFQIMVGIAGFLLAVSVWVFLKWIRRSDFNAGKSFLTAIALSGPLSVIAMEAGWVVTEVGRQPWIVHGYMKTSEAVTETTGLWWVLLLTVLIYFVLAIGLLLALRFLAGRPVGSHDR